MTIRLNNFIIHLVNHSHFMNYPFHLLQPHNLKPPLNSHSHHPTHPSQRLPLILDPPPLGT